MGRKIYIWIYHIGTEIPKHLPKFVCYRYSHVQFFLDRLILEVQCQHVSGIFSENRAGYL